MSGDPVSPPIVVAIDVADHELADRLAAMLADVAGLRLAGPGEAADVTLAAPRDGGPLTGDAGWPDPLTPREREVLALMSEGASNRVIAQTLGISVHTAKFHVGQVIDKLDATGRTDAVAHAARTGVIHL